MRFVSSFAEFGHVASVGKQNNATRLATVIEDAGTPLPVLTREFCGEMFERIGVFFERLVHPT